MDLCFVFSLSKMKIPMFGRFNKFYSCSYLLSQSSLFSLRFPKCSSLQTRLLHSENKTELFGDKKESWVPIYRLRSIAFFQAISQLKIILTGLLISGCPVVIYKYLHDQASSSLVCTALGSAAFSLCSLIIFSWLSIKIVGVVSIHRESGLVRIGHLTFWGRRQNTILNSGQIVPPSDLIETPEKNSYVRVGTINANPNSTKHLGIERTFLLTNVKSEILDREKFKQIFGFIW
ncbi:unnamed protein product [Schistosoma rodhaini]|uniref:Transmembrane protein 186 n=1 Tax=Schistosoma rodhaini TaxID=6188 RepID=A0AA85GDN2_9TREM|nr:unnamed protein product [Schistosoma rodhaini]CAH8675826.1 unnamed protein product [Schistosoma rodhaini]CAH8675831.1 unnamed protein product [Schistosoma rodhaini]